MKKLIRTGKITGYIKAFPSIASAVLMKSDSNVSEASPLKRWPIVMFGEITFK
ncbi:hypothetical protein ELI_2945 [Eubacterium callanderi]|uniref:Uncharacterized protein n=1 Tax=Eubacterium callanderi TaxID=53442 RepID=E3GEC8_9FIRM|nr:hypothetical protein ELI_2945 [Eubacterium callanderi]